MTPERAAEFLNLLTAKVAAWEPSITAFNTLRATDVNLALAWVQNTRARLLLRVKYGGGETLAKGLADEFVTALERGMMAHIVELAAPQKWKVPRENFVRDLGRLALAEHISPKLCPECHGRGSRITRRKLVKNCPRCEGKGRITYSDTYRASLMGVSKQSWGQTWRARYRAISGLLDMYEDMAARSIAKRLR